MTFTSLYHGTKFYKLCDTVDSFLEIVSLRSRVIFVGEGQHDSNGVINLTVSLHNKFKPNFVGVEAPFEMLTHIYRGRNLPQTAARYGASRSDILPFDVSNEKRERHLATLGLYGWREKLGIPDSDFPKWVKEGRRNHHNAEMTANLATLYSFKSQTISSTDDSLGTMMVTVGSGHLLCKNAISGSFIRNMNTRGYDLRNETTEILLAPVKSGIPEGETRLCVSPKSSNIYGKEIFMIYFRDIRHESSEGLTLDKHGHFNSLESYFSSRLAETRNLALTR